MTENLFQPFELGDLTLANRLVMAPMTRNRATPDGLVTAMMITHYQQRAAAGLIVTEAVRVAALGTGYPCMPGLFTPAQSESWRPLTEAVHAAGGRIFAQLIHCGRISHPSFHADGALPIAPSAIKPDGQCFTYGGLQDFVTPRALSVAEIAGVVGEFKRAAELARDAGFDGVEIHGANGYLIDQFLRDGSNHRDDAYGGTVANRFRFLAEIVDAVTSVLPAGRVGVRLSPENSFNSMTDSDPQAHFTHFAAQLGTRGLAYLHVLEGDMMGGPSVVDHRPIRDAYKGTYIANNGYDAARAEAAIVKGDADLVAFGAPFIANPDLVARYKAGAPLNEADRSTFYGGDEKGYTDYPFLDGEGSKAA